MYVDPKHDAGKLMQQITKMTPTARFSQWEISCGGCPLVMGKDERRKAWVAVGAELAYDWRNPNRVLTLQSGDAANDK